MDKGPLYLGRSRIARVAISCYTVLLLIIQYDTYNMMNKDIFSQIVMALSNALRALHNMFHWIYRYYQHNHFKLTHYDQELLGTL